MNRKGFTLIELLVVIAIFTIITGMSISLIRNIKIKNEQSKYNTYGESLIAAAKLYRDSYEKDLFGKKTSGCALVSFSMLNEKGLIKDFPDNSISCNSKNTLVKVVKLDNKYGYSYQLYCGTKDINGIASNPVLRSSSFSKTVESVIKKQESDIDEDEDGFTDKYCNLTSGITIMADPAIDNSAKEKHMINLKISSTTGFLSKSGIEYVWIKADDKNNSTIIDYDSLTSWNNWSFNLDSAAKQKAQIISNSTHSVDLSKIITTPEDAPNYYLLVIRPNNLRDLTGEVWKENGNNTNYKVFGTYNVAKKYTITYDSAGGSDCPNQSALHEKNGNEVWGNLCTPTRVGYTFASWIDTSGNIVKDSTLVESDLELTAQWVDKQMAVTFDCNGGTGGTINNFSSGIGKQKFHTSSNTCTKKGYTLLGWANDNNATSIDYSFDNEVNDNWIKDNMPSKTLYAVWRPNICTITYSPNGGKFTKNSTNTVEECYYSETNNCTNDMRNASGGYYSATRTKYVIPTGKEWYNGSNFYNQSNGYKATDFCENLETGDQSVTLKVRWIVHTKRIRAASNMPLYVCPVDVSDTATPSNCHWGDGSGGYYNHMEIRSFNITNNIASFQVILQTNSSGGNVNVSCEAKHKKGKICLQKGNLGDKTCHYVLAKNIDLYNWSIKNKTVFNDTIKVNLKNLEAGKYRIIAVGCSNYNSFTKKNSANHNDFLFEVLK